MASTESGNQADIMIKGYLDLVLFLLLCYLTFSDGQNCVSNPDVSTPGELTITDLTQVIIPSFSFNCNGRINGIAISMLRTAYERGYLPLFQVWHPLSSDSNVYSKIAQINVHDVGTRITGSHYIYNVSLSISDQIEFQSGDVIGYYQPSQSVIKVGIGYNPNHTLYYKSNVDHTIATINISSEEYSKASVQPLISVMTNTQCDNMLIANGRLTSCSSGRVGVGYEGDTCNFTCNTGYELIGSDTRTCQSDGSWNGTDDVCRRGSCLSLTNPNNGMINNCSLGADGVPSYEDTCSFTCNTGYELTGSDTRTCQSDGSWSGSDDVCRRVSCVSLSDPENGNVTCPSNTSVFQDTCTFYCNRGYQLEGNRQTECSADGTWSSEPVTCTILKCNDPEVEIASSQSVGVCNVTYGSSCSLNCSSGYSVSGNGEHVCDDVIDEGTLVKWRSIGGTFSCVAGTSTESNSGKDSVVLIIAGSVGGVALFIIISLLCVIVLCARQYHNIKRSLTLDNSTEIEMNSDIKLNANPSYDNSLTKQLQNKKQENQYDYVLHKNISGQDNTQNTIKIDSNPSYESTQSSNIVVFDTSKRTVNDAAIQPNPSYISVCKEAVTVYDKNCYDEANSCSTQREDYHKGAGSAIKEEEEPVYDDTGGVKLEENPSYNKII